MRCMVEGCCRERTVIDAEEVEEEDRDYHGLFADALVMGSEEADLRSETGSSDSPRQTPLGGADYVGDSGSVHAQESGLTQRALDSGLHGEKNDATWTPGKMDECRSWRGARHGSRVVLGGGGRQVSLDPDLHVIEIKVGLARRRGVRDRAWIRWRQWWRAGAGGAGRGRRRSAAGRERLVGVGEEGERDRLW